MASKKITAMPNLAGAQVPTDLATLVDLSAVPASQNVKSTLNDLFAEITKNITDLAVQFADGAGVATLSPVNKGRLRYNATAQSFQASENAGAYVNLLKGSGADGQVAFYSAGATLTGSNNLFYDSVNVRLGVGVGITPAAPVHVAVDGSSLAVRVTEAAATLDADFSASGGVAFLGTTTTHPLELWTDATTRIRIEAGGAVGINTTTPGAQLNVVSGAAGTIGLLVAGASGATADLFRVDLVASDRLRFTPSSELILGKASTATATLTLAQSAGATTTGLRAGNAANSLIYVLPLADPTVGQVLTAAAPVAGVVQLSWAAGGGGTITGSGAAGQVTYWSGASSITGSNNLFYDSATVRLGIGVGTSPTAPLHVETDAFNLAVRVTDTAATLNADFSAGSGVAFLGTTTTHPLELWTDATTRIRIETSGVVGINNAAPGAQLDVVSGAAGTVGLIVSSAASPSVNIITVRQNATAVFEITSSGGLVHAPVGLTTGNGAAFSSSTVSSGNVVSIAATGTAAASNSKHALFVSTSGANATSGQTTYAAEFSNTSTGTSSTNVALQLTASGGSTNTALNVTAGTIVQTSNSATAFESGPNGGTNPVFRLVNNTASQATGLSITGGTAASNEVALTALSSGAAAGMRFLLKDATASSNFVVQYATTGDLFFISGNGNINFRVSGTDKWQYNGSNTNWVWGSDVLMRWSSTTSASGTVDLTIRRAAAANLAFGATDAASPVAQTLSVQNVATGTSNTAGAIWTFANSRGTGTASGGGFAFQVAPAGSSGSSQNALVEAVRITGEGLVGIGTSSPAARLHVATSNATTAAVTNQAVLEALSTGTPAAGFGPGLQFNGQSSTTAAQNMGRIAAVWTNATHAFRTAAITFSLVNLAAAQTEYGRWTPDTLVVHAGTNPTVYTSGSAIVKLYVIDDVTPPMAVNAFFTTTAASCARFQTLRGRGSNASPAAVQNGDALGAYEFLGMYSTSTNSFGVGARIVAAATETWSLTANGTDLQFHVANNGGTITERMTLTRTGTLRINPNGAYSGFTTNTLLQVGNYASWSNATIAGIFAQSSGNRVLDLVGTLGQTADIIRAFNDTGSVDLFNLTAAGIVASVAGASTSQVRHGGVLKVNTTAASNTGTGATDLISYSLPASTLGTNNDFIEIEAWGTYAANGNSKTVTLEFGGTTIYTTGAIAQNGGAWSIKARVVRTGATTQDAIATIIASGSVGDDATFTTPAETLSGAITIKCTATGGASSDITQEGLIVKWYPAN